MYGTGWACGAEDETAVLCAELTRYLLPLIFQQPYGQGAGEPSATPRYLFMPGEQKLLMCHDKPLWSLRGCCGDRSPWRQNFASLPVSAVLFRGFCTRYSCQLTGMEPRAYHRVSADLRSLCLLVPTKQCHSWTRINRATQVAFCGLYYTSVLSWSWRQGGLELRVHPRGKKPGHHPSSSGLHRSTYQRSGNGI